MYYVLPPEYNNILLCSCRAESDAMAVFHEFSNEASVYSMLTTARFKGKALMSYVSVETIALSTKPVQIGLKSPIIKDTTP